MSSLDRLSSSYAPGSVISNWSNTLSCRPKRVLVPTSIDAVQLIVNEARLQKKRIRPVGEHTAPGEAFLTDEWMVRMHRIAHIDIDRETRTATLGAGVTIRTANRVLYEGGLCIPTVGSIDEVSIGGVFCSGVHGSSLTNSSASDRATACTLVTSDGQIRKVRRDGPDQNEADLFKATGCGSGATGIVYDITFDLDEAFGLAPTYEMISLRAALRNEPGKKNLIDIARQNEYVKIWYFPNTTHPDSDEPDTIVWRADRTDAPPYPGPPSALENLQKKFIHILHATAIFICYYIAPLLMPYFNRLLMFCQNRGLPMKADVQPGPLAQLMDCMYWQHVQEWSVPIRKDESVGAVQALRELIAFLDSDRVVGGGLTAPFEIRFSSPAQTYWLSPLAHDNAEGVIWLEPIVYRPLNLPEPAKYKRLFAVLDDISRRHGGKPHLAKPRRQSTQAELHAMYPHIAKWNNTVRKVDPEGMFWNDWFEGQFGNQCASSRREKS